MKSPLHILHLEDDPNDAALVQSTLEAGGIVCAVTLAQGRDEFEAALERGGIDLILSDFSLPSFDGMRALQIVRDKWPTIPLILVSGSMGEERAIDSLKSGATDYVLKERLARLVPAVRRAMNEVEERTEHRLLEKQFVEAQKMEVLGHLAGGVAHDFNNILAVIMGYSDLLMRDLGADDQSSKLAEEIMHAAKRAAGLTRQLLVFSRKQTVQPVVLDLNEVVRDLDKMLRRIIDEHIEMKVELGKQVGRIKADSGQVGQVLMNLIVNARDAMPNGGKIIIQTSSKQVVAADACVAQGVTPGDYTILAISDTGTGMTDEVKARIFEAFFTTKPQGKGTGLGMATCQMIVKQSGGHIEISSELGRGTTFKVYFPQVGEPIDTAAKQVESGPLPRGTETLLVVEDEPSVRKLACGVLAAQGYEVLSAANGQEGLHAVRDLKGKVIHLVITDVVMPQMGGKVMAEWLKATYPELKILFTSGYTDEAMVQRGMLESGMDFLPKPYTPATLARKVRAMLNNETDSTFFRKHIAAPVTTLPTTP